MTPLSDSTLFDRAASAQVLTGAGDTLVRTGVEAQVQDLAARLSGTRFALNLCDDRRHFLIAFASVIAAGGANLLPPNRQRETIADLARRFGGTANDIVIVHDGSIAGLNLPCATIDVRPAANELSVASGDVSGRARPAHASLRPAAPRDALAAVSFTSGSTGRPGANEKSWGGLIDSTGINAHAMLEGLEQPACPVHGPMLNLVATVPPQHMYGLELSILLPMRCDVSVRNGQPLYPADVIASLDACPEPRGLVTTPAHLRALLASGLELPRVRRVFSATAPLSRELAQASIAGFGGDLVEIYGCSEVGSIARRESAFEDDWRVFDGLELQQMPSTGDERVSCRVKAPHLDSAPELQDALDIVAPGRFRLRGRQGDLINIAGKRGSLLEINQRLLAIPGVVDAIVFLPHSEASEAHARLAALVVAPTLSRDVIVQALRANLDPIFVPRPLLFTDRLPRQPSSKLMQNDVLALYQRLCGARARIER